MTAGLAVGRPAGGDACSEKCLQVTGAHGVGESKEEGGRAGNPEVWVERLLLGLSGSHKKKQKQKQKKEKKNPFALVKKKEKEKKAEEEGDTVHDQQGPQFSSCSRALSISPW